MQVGFTGSLEDTNSYVSHIQSDLRLVASDSGMDPL
jgi:hypothetical protein